MRAFLGTGPAKVSVEPDADGQGFVVVFELTAAHVAISMPPAVARQLADGIASAAEEAERLAP